MNGIGFGALGMGLLRHHTQRPEPYAIIPLSYAS